MPPITYATDKRNFLGVEYAGFFIVLYSADTTRIDTNAPTKPVSRTEVTTTAMYKMNQPYSFRLYAPDMSAGAESLAGSISKLLTSIAYASEKPKHMVWEMGSGIVEVKLPSVMALMS